ncbi:MAG TPA: mechanosensitive ion channel family protein [Chiayiivirga sp.]|nr:mechanosensitive ion channel family protein [Chiayiivirga sp.]
MMQGFDWLDATLAPHPRLYVALMMCGLCLVAWLANWVTQHLLLAVLGRLVTATRSKWDDALLKRHVLSRLANVVPALVILAGVDLIPGVPLKVAVAVRLLAMPFVVLTAAMAAGNLLNAFNDIYEQTSENARRRPIKSYLQLVKIGVYLVAMVLIVSLLLDKSPLALLTGLGAMTALLMLVFKDTILSLVAAVQLTSNDMLRVGDWIEMPSQNADGDVIDINLHTVKVQNWDKTISMIPTWALITQSFRNWRGMTDAGGRRIKRSVLLDQTSVKFLDAEEQQKLCRFALISDYLDAKRSELDRYNARFEASGIDPVNRRRVTNLGTFRAYVTAYLRAHPGVAQDMTLMVRQLDPTPEGLPLQVYCFSADVDWVPFENLAGDIFDHLLAVLPEFGLQVFQAPAGFDFRAGLGLLAHGSMSNEPQAPEPSV